MANPEDRLGDRAAIKDAIRKYHAALHAVQTGVMYEMQINPNPTTPKHLLTGILGSLIEQDALIHVLARRDQINIETTDPQEVRLLVNMAFVAHAALVTVLINQGVITEKDYYEALAMMAQREKGLYEERLTAHYGKPVTLG